MFDWIRMLRGISRLTKYGVRTMHPIRFMSSLANSESIISLLRDNGLKYKMTDSHICVEECPFCHPTHGKADNMWKLNIASDPGKEGVYFCHRCNSKGNWSSLVENLNGKVKDYPLEQTPVVQVQNEYKIIAPEKAAEYRSNISNESFETGLKYCKGRGINVSTLKLYHVGFGNFDFKSSSSEEWVKKMCITFPFVTNSLNPMFYSNDDDDMDMVVSRIKIRGVHEKSNQMFIPSGGPPGFFGWHTIPVNSKEIVLTEGEFDSLAVFQDTGLPTVSVPNGCNSFPKELLSSLDRFTTIYIWFDDDEPGIKGAIKLGELIGPDRCKYVIGDGAAKDANSVLLKGRDLREYIESASFTAPTKPKYIKSEPSVDKAVVDVTDTNDEKNWLSIGDTAVLTFGKYSGSSYTSVMEQDPEYLEYIFLKNGNLPEVVLNEAERGMINWIRQGKLLRGDDFLHPSKCDSFSTVEEWDTYGESQVFSTGKKFLGMTYSEIVRDPKWEGYHEWARTLTSPSLSVDRLIRWFDSNPESVATPPQQEHRDDILNLGGDIGGLSFGQALLAHPDKCIELCDTNEDMKEFVLSRPLEEINVTVFKNWLWLGNHKRMKYGKYENETFVNIMIQHPDYLYFCLRREQDESAFENWMSSKPGSDISDWKLRGDLKLFQFGPHRKKSFADVFERGGLGTKSAEHLVQWAVGFPGISLFSSDSNISEEDWKSLGNEILLTVGKYEGSTVSSVCSSDLSYCSWMLVQKDSRHFLTANAWLAHRNKFN